MSITTWHRALAQFLVIGCLAAGAAARANEAPVAQQPLPGFDAGNGAISCAGDVPTIGNDQPAKLGRSATAGTAARSASAGATRVALGGTFCRWVCYPGSGCEYQCRFLPQ